ncbi:MAG TPA: bifunctional hydroxymethylpyrimidine kinase/phosphomethylpyrimidine kinase, partial [Dehalococcoidia bacterium]|nr:bifunctional hydroxymethylpyrimidine kinase/phosphomethylpyrimidine kinase [Dehalococcoidia bacterium]
AQNTVGVQAILELPPDLIASQIESVVSDIGVDAVKTGMLGSFDVVQAVSDAIQDNGLERLVVDPVMVAKSGDVLLPDDAVEALRTRLLPLALVATPNLPEAEILTGLAIRDQGGMRIAARAIAALGAQWVVIKGGHLAEDQDAVDLVFDGREFFPLRAARIATKNTHGTGCTFSAAIAAGLARGVAPEEAIRKAKQFVTRAIEGSLGIGTGHGPTNHFVGTRTEW